MFKQVWRVAFASVRGCAREIDVVAETAKTALEKILANVEFYDDKLSDRTYLLESDVTEIKKLGKVLY